MIPIINSAFVLLLIVLITASAAVLLMYFFKKKSWLQRIHMYGVNQLIAAWYTIGLSPMLLLFGPLQTPDKLHIGIQVVLAMGGFCLFIMSICWIVKCRGKIKES